MPRALCQFASLVAAPLVPYLAMGVLGLCGCRPTELSRSNSQFVVTIAPVGSSAATLTTQLPRAIPSDIDFVSLEGPFWVTDGGYLLFSDVAEQNSASAKIYRLDPGSDASSGRFVQVSYPGAPTSTNGLALDNQGRLIACERFNGVLARIDGKERSILLDRAPGVDALALNAPNDVAVRPDGNLYFSDTTWGRRPGEHAPTAVYRVSPEGVASMVLQMDMPNGVALSPDGKTLYVGSDTQNRVLQLPVAENGTVGSAKPFVDSTHVPNGKLRVPDGICLDDLGRVYVTNNSPEVSAIEVFSPDGHFEGSIAFPVPPSNCSFGGSDRRTLFATTAHAIYAVHMETPGKP